ncbi:MAG: DUF1003 domain-containing protein [Nanoarchaeota archaeon]
MQKEESPIHSIIHKQRTYGQRAADKLTKGVGSWIFIITFLIFLTFWILVNVYAWIEKWDPYPFILLNLVLSCIAALQAPIILMSQNRQAHTDRLKSEYDYAVNRKAEREIEEMKKQLDRIEKKLK